MASDDDKTPSTHNGQLVYVLTLMFIIGCTGAAGTIMAKGSPLTIVVVALGGAVVGAGVAAVFKPVGGIRTDVWKFALSFGLLGPLVLIFSVLYRVRGS